jgi:carbonic anhydrase
MAMRIHELTTDHVRGNCDCDRRRVLKTGLAAIVGSSLPSLVSRRAMAQTSMTPDAAIAELVAGNARYVGKKMTSLDEDLAEIRQNTVEKQEPFAAVLSCADSRVPVEMVFDQSIGRLFTTRVAGNVASSDVIASLEYGAAVLGVKAILVLGHSGCGAVKAAIYGKPVPGQISSLYPYLRQAVDQGHHDQDATGKANAQIQAKTLAESSPVIHDLLAKNAIKVVAGYYDLASGKIEQLT